MFVVEKFGQGSVLKNSETALQLVINIACLQYVQYVENKGTATKNF